MAGGLLQSHDHGVVGAAAIGGVAVGANVSDAAGVGGGGVSYGAVEADYELILALIDAGFLFVANAIVEGEFGDDTPAVLQVARVVVKIQAQTCGDGGVPGDFAHRTVWLALSQQNCHAVVT